MTPARPVAPHGPSQATPAPPAPAPPSRQEEQRELDHRLANSLQLAADFLIFEHNRVLDPRARAALIETADRLSAVGQMHRFLAVHHQAGGVDLDPFLREFGVLIGDTTGLECTVESEPIEVAAEIAQQLAIAVNELAMNAAKHAYAWGDRGPLHITCRRLGARLAITVADEGEGLGQDFALDDTEGLGMTIVQAIVRQLDGSLEAVNDRGARFTISVPLAAGAAPIPRSFAKE